MALLTAATPEEQRQNTRGIALGIRMAKIKRSEGGRGATLLVDEVPIEGELEAVALLRVLTSEIEQGKDHGGRRILVRRGVVQREKEGRNRVRLAEPPEQREDDRVAAIFATAEEGQGEKSAAGSAIAKAAVVRPQGENTGCGQLLVGRIAAEIEGQKRVCGGSAGGIAEVPEERKEHMGRTRRIVAAVVRPEDGRVCIAWNIIVVVVDEIEVDLVGLVPPVNNRRKEHGQVVLLGFIVASVGTAWP